MRINAVYHVIMILLVTMTHLNDVFYAKNMHSLVFQTQLQCLRFLQTQENNN